MPVATVKQDEKKTFAPIPEGVHQGVCVSVIDIGTQLPKNPTFKASRKIWITWELPHERLEGDDKPRRISENFTLSMHEKGRLRPMLKCWLGSQLTNEDLVSFDTAKLIGRNCQLNVVHSKSATDPNKVFANIRGVIPLPKGMPPISPSGKTVVYDIPEAGPIVIPDDIPEWLANKIKESVEYKERMGSIPPVPEAANDGAPY